MAHKGLSSTSVHPAVGGTATVLPRYRGTSCSSGTRAKNMDERTDLSVSRVIASPEIVLELRTARSALRLEGCPD